MKRQLQWYEIRLQGLLGPEWAEWFDGMEIRAEAGERTVLSGPLADQAALHGLLARVRDLNLVLVSVNPVEPAETEGE